MFPATEVLLKRTERDRFSQFCDFLSQCQTELSRPTDALESRRLGLSGVIGFVSYLFRFFIFVTTC